VENGVVVDIAFKVGHEREELVEADGGYLVRVKTERFKLYFYTYVKYHSLNFQHFLRWIVFGIWMSKYIAIFFVRLFFFCNREASSSGLHQVGGWGKASWEWQPREREN